MVLLTTIVTFLQEHSHLVYPFLFLGTFFETLIGPSFFIYGELIFLAGSILAGMGILNIWFVALVCILGGILGDSASFFIGRKFGSIILKKFFNRKNKYLNPKNYSKVKKIFHNYGYKSVFLSRFIPQTSWIIPFFSGTVGLKYKKFLKYNIPAVTLGISQFLIIGYFFGFSYNLVFLKMQKYSLCFVLVLIILFLILKKLNFLDKIKEKLL